MCINFISYYLETSKTVTKLKDNVQRTYIYNERYIFIKVGLHSVISYFWKQRSSGFRELENHQ